MRSILNMAIAGTFVTCSGLAQLAHAAPGDLDTSFGTNGFVTTNIPNGSSTANGGAVQPDGKVIAVGHVGATNFGKSNFALTRYNANGTLDSTFGSNGVVSTDFGNSGGASIDTVYAMALQTDGKIIAAGTTEDPTASTNFALIRYNVDGSVDTAFGTNGRVHTDFGARKQDVARAVKVQPDGKVVVVGYTDIGGSATNYEFAAARYNPDGSLDLTFGTRGLVKTGFGTALDRAHAVAIQGDNKIVVGGEKGNDFALMRYHVNGTLDTTFDGDGKATTAFGTKIDAIRGLAIQADGKIVAAGDVNADDFGDGDIGVARYTVAGRLDTSFDGDGKVLTTVAASEGASAIALQGDGKIVVGGSATLPETDNDFALLRYNGDGSLDTAFGGGDGKVTATANPGSTHSELAYALTLDATGRYILIGGGVGGFTLARFLN